MNQRPEFHLEIGGTVSPVRVCEGCTYHGGICEKCARQVYLEGEFNLLFATSAEFTLSPGKVDLEIRIPIVGVWQGKQVGVDEIRPITQAVSKAMAEKITERLQDGLLDWFLSTFDHLQRQWFTAFQIGYFERLEANGENNYQILVCLPEQFALFPYIPDLMRAAGDAGFQKLKEVMQ